MYLHMMSSPTGIIGCWYEGCGTTFLPLFFFFLFSVFSLLVVVGFLLCFSPQLLTLVVGIVAPARFSPTLTYINT